MPGGQAHQNEIFQGSGSKFFECFAVCCVLRRETFPISGPKIHGNQMLLDMKSVLFSDGTIHFPKFSIILQLMCSFGIGVYALSSSNCACAPKSGKCDTLTIIKQTDV